VLNSNISSIHSYNIVNFGPLTVEIGSGVWGTPANFNEFRVLASLLQRRRSPEANQTLHDVWLSPASAGTLYIHFGSFGRLTEFCQVKTSLCLQVLRSPILAVLLHGSQPVGVRQKTAAWYNEWNYGTFTKGATYIRLSDHHSGHRPTF